MTKRLIFLLLVLLAWVSDGAASEQKTRQWIVVTPPAFREALKPLIDHRSADGFQTIVIETTEILKNEQIQQGNGNLLKNHLQQLSQDFQGATYVLLVGEALADNPESRNSVVPALRGTVGRMKGQPSDHGYGCLGTDLMPKVAVGRFPARNVEEVGRLVKKTLKAEKDSLTGLCGNRLLMVAGNPGGNTWLEKRLIDAYLQSAATERLNRLHPYWEVRSIIHCSNSPFCVPNSPLKNGQKCVFFLFQTAVA